MAAHERALDRAESARREKSSPSFSQRGRIVFPQLAGISLDGLVGAPLPFGSRGVGGWSSGLISFGASSSEVGSNRVSSHSLLFGPSADVFVTDRWTVGLSLGAMRFTSVSVSSSPASVPVETSGYSVSATPRIGRTIDLGPLVVWPKLGIGYGVGRSETGASTYEPAHRTVSRTLSSTASLDVVLPLTSFVILGLGPSLSYQHSAETTNSTQLRFGDRDDVSLGIQAHLGITLR